MKFVMTSVCAAAALWSFPATAFDGWRVEKVTPIESKSSAWDYLTYDAAANRLFIGHRKEGLQIFDVASGKVVKVLDNTVTQSSNGAILRSRCNSRCLTSGHAGCSSPFADATA